MQLPARLPVVFGESIPRNSEVEQAPHCVASSVPGSWQLQVRFQRIAPGWLLSSSKVPACPCCRCHRFACCFSKSLPTLHLWMEILAEVCWQSHVGDFPVTWGVSSVKAGVSACVMESPPEETQLGDVVLSSGHPLLAKAKYEWKVIMNLSKQKI